MLVCRSVFVNVRVCLGMCAFVDAYVFGDECAYL